MPQIIKKSWSVPYYKEAENVILGWAASLTIYPSPFAVLPPNAGFGISGNISKNLRAGGLAPGWGIEISGGVGYGFKR